MVPNFIMIWKKNCILRSFIFPWTKSVKITCFSEHRELMGGQAVSASVWMPLYYIIYDCVLNI